VKRWWLVIALLLSLGVNAGIVAALMVRRWSADRPQKPAAEKPAALPNNQNGQGGQGGVPQRVIRLADQLGLEGDQRRRFISLQGSFFAETLRLRTDQAETQRELRRALSAPNPDQARIQTLLQESGHVFLALEQALAKNVLDSRRLLNPEQERKFLKILGRLRPGNGGLGGGGQGQGQQQRRQRRNQALNPQEQDGRPGDRGNRRDPATQDGSLVPGSGPGGVQEQTEGSGNRQRRPGLGRGARWWNRRFGGQGRPGGPGRRAQEQAAPPGDASPAP
jgi:Spy/CpxP family protein refolding chaperone